MLDPRTGRGTGAHAGDYDEAKLAIELRNSIVDNIRSNSECVSFQVIKDDDYERLPDLSRRIMSLVSTHDLLLDIHWNAAADTRATGIEAYIPSRYSKTELRLAADLVEGLGKILKLPLRGVTEGRRGVKLEHHSQHPQLAMMRPNCENVFK